MESYKLVAHRRESVGKGIARKMRSQGLLPAVFYGPKVKSLAVACGTRDLIDILHHGQNVLIDLEIKDGKGAKKDSRHRVMLKDVQTDPIRGVPLHVDLYEVSMKEVMTVNVPIHLVGKPVGIKMGGILEQVRRELEIECLPSEIPSEIEVDVSHLDIGDSVHVEEIVADKFKILTDPEMTVATVVPPVVEEEPVAEEEVPIEGEEEAEVLPEEEKETVEEE